MVQNIEVLKSSSLFHNMGQNDIFSMLECLSAKEMHFNKGEFVFHYGEIINHVGLVLTGSVHIIKEDFWGNRTILTNILPSNLLGETYACVPAAALEVSAIAAIDCDMLLLDVHKMLSPCTNSCNFHVALIHNFLTDLAAKNLMLTKKIEHMSKRSTREKLLSYLSTESLKTKCSSFDIAFDRQQLADYLSVDRSAMSNELCKLRAEGFLSFHKNHFTLNKDTVK